MGAAGAVNTHTACLALIDLNIPCDPLLSPNRESALAWLKAAQAALFGAEVA